MFQNDFEKKSQESLDRTKDANKSDNNYRNERYEETPEFQENNSNRSGPNSGRIFYIDDKEEISKRLTQLRLSLGLSEKKNPNNMIEQHKTTSNPDYFPLATKNNSRKETQREVHISMLNQENKDENNLLSDKNSSQRDLAKYLSHIDNSTSKYRPDYESNFGPASGANTRRIGEGSYKYDNNQVAIDLDLKLDNVEKKLRSSERLEKIKYAKIVNNATNTTKIQKKIENLKKTPTISMSDSLKTEDLEDEYNRLISKTENYSLYLNESKSNEIPKLNEPKTKPELKDLKKQTHEQEKLLRDPSFYKNQIDELENMIVDYNQQIQTALQNEKILKQQVISFKYKEEAYKTEIALLKDELDQLRDTQKIDRGHTLEGDNAKDQYIIKLETDVKLLNSQISNLSQIKTELEIKCDTLEHNLKLSTSKVSRELEIKYKTQIQEAQYLLKTLKRENEILLESSIESKQVINLSQLSPSTNKLQQILSPKEKKSKKRSPLKEKSQIKGNNQEEIISNLQDKIKELEKSNQKLQEENEIFNIQLKNIPWKKETINTSTTNTNTTILNENQDLYRSNNERRHKTLSDAVLYWKERAYKLENEMKTNLESMKRKNEELKFEMLSHNNRFKEEIYAIVKKIKNHYEKENCGILEIIQELEEKHNNNQAKLADMRSKVRKLAIVNTLEKPFQDTIKKKTRHCQKKSS